MSCATGVTDDFDSEPSSAQAGAGGTAGGVGGSGQSSGGGGAAAGGASSQGGSGGPPRTPVAGEVAFIELMVDPGGPSDELGEWFELKNVSGATLDLAGCRLRDLETNGDDFTLDNTPLLMAPSEVLIFAKSASSQQNGNLPPVALAFGNKFSLGNGGDELLLECGGQLIDQLDYTGTWPFEPGASMQLRNASQNTSANDSSANWCTAGTVYAGSEKGSPGSDSHCP